MNLTNCWQNAKKVFSLKLIFDICLLVLGNSPNLSPPIGLNSWIHHYFILPLFSAILCTFREQENKYVLAWYWWCPFGKALLAMPIHISMWIVLIGGCQNNWFIIFTLWTLSLQITTLFHYWLYIAVNKAYKMFEDDEQVKYCEAIVEEARSQLETKVN